MFSAGNCGIVTGAISAVEMAMWGLKARKMKIPLYELFGGKIKDYVKVYGSFPRFSKIDDLIKAVEFTVNKGFDFINVVDSFRIIQKFLSNYAEYYPWKRRTLGIGASTMRTW
jgi:L-alanine-DL-glutamate epimerase-like enolase superfamily enzyme